LTETRAALLAVEITSTTVVVAAAEVAYPVQAAAVTTPLRSESFRQVTSPICSSQAKITTAAAALNPDSNSSNKQQATTTALAFLRHRRAPPLTPPLSHRQKITISYFTNITNRPRSFPRPPLCCRQATRTFTSPQARAPARLAQCAIRS